MDDTAVFESDGFRVERRLDVDGGVLRLLWKGDYKELEFPDQLATLLDLVPETAACRAPVLEMRFEELRSVNSSMMVQISRVVRELSGRHSRLSVYYDPEVDFQAVLFPLLEERLASEQGERFLSFHPVGR